MPRTPRRHPAVAVALAAGTLLLAGCGTHSDDSGSGSSAGGATAVSPSATGSPSGSPSGGPSSNPSGGPSGSPSGCSDNVVLGLADARHTVCVTKGGTVRLDLDGSTARPWAAVTVTGGELEATNSGILVRPGDARAAFRAVSTGTARLSTSRPLCPAASPGAVSCKGLQEWAVTVVVTAS